MKYDIHWKRVNLHTIQILQELVLKYYDKPQCDYNGKSRKKRMSDMHGKYVDGALLQHAENALVLNVDDYHNIHVQ